MVCEHLSKRGHFKAATHLIDEANVKDNFENNSYGILFTWCSIFNDMAVFEKANQVFDSRRNHDCEPALQWCNENKPQLFRIESSLEFHN